MNRQVILRNDFLPGSLCGINGKKTTLSRNDLHVIFLKVLMEQEVNKKKLFVGSLNYDTTEESLKEYFSQAGAVESAVIIMDKMSGRSKGFGFVEMSTEEEAKKAVEMFDGKEFEGRDLTVNEARPPRKNFRDNNQSFNDGGESNSNW